MKEEIKQQCENECDCKDNCECEECNCDENCNCKDDCKCENECDCKEDCKCEESDCDENSSNCQNELEEQIKNLENELLKSKAEFINYRKRLDEEHSKFLKFCNEDLIKELLPILDNFERAINMDDDNLNDEVSKFLSGIKMIYCNFVNILTNNGVVEIDGANKPFDPMYHEAIMTEKREGVEQGIVLEIMQKGYILKGKVIRPAMVKVSE